MADHTSAHLAKMHPLSRHVAVVGAGPSGLVAARELRREGHSVVVFERGNQIGGTWVFTPEVESDPIGLDPNRNIVHSSMYRSLRTNLPREIMSFRDYPFGPKEGDEERDPRRFPGHKEVLKYLEDFAGEFGICEMVRFETEVVFVGLVESDKWTVKSKSKTGEYMEEIYDAVVVCSGHYTNPRVADISGITTWKGTQIHSHNYRTPEPFRDQVVVIVGSSFTAIDISKEISKIAKEVHISSRCVASRTTATKPGFQFMWLKAVMNSGYDNMSLHSEIETVHEDGSIVFTDGSSVVADTIIHCTGYKYYFPFLQTKGIVTVDGEDNRVGPLFKHVFPPALAPSLSFVGIPWKSVSFPTSELQSKWVAGVLSNRIALPSEEEMMEDVKAFYSSLEASGKPERYTHDIFEIRHEYADWLAAQCGCIVSEEWRDKMELTVVRNWLVRPKTYQDEWDDNHLVLQAYEAFRESSTIAQKPNMPNVSKTECSDPDTHLADQPKVVLPP